MADIKDTNEIPNKKVFYIRLMGRDIKVIRVPPTTIPGCDGIWNCSDYTISISNKLSSAAATETLTHEIFHAILYLSGNTNLLTEQVEESIVHAYTTSLTQHLDIKSFLI